MSLMSSMDNAFTADWWTDTVETEVIYFLLSMLSAWFSFLPQSPSWPIIYYLVLLIVERSKTVRAVDLDLRWLLIEDGNWFGIGNYLRLLPGRLVVKLLWIHTQEFGCRRRVKDCCYLAGLAHDSLKFETRTNGYLERVLSLLVLSLEVPGCAKEA